MEFKKLLQYLFEPHLFDERLNRLRDHKILYRFLTHVLHPVHEWLHTGHDQFSQSNYFIVKHYRLGSLVTVDKVKPCPQGNYKGKNEFGDQRFVLLERRYVHDE